MGKYLHLNQDFLKIIALIAMTFDHISRILFNPPCDTMIFLGRIAFPIFAYLIILHLYSKQCFKKYFDHLFIFAIITSAVIFMLDGFMNNILWSFLIAVACIWFLQETTHKIKSETLKFILYPIIFSLFFCLSFYADYSIFGFCYLLSLYGFFKYKTPTFIILCLVFGALINPTDVIGATISLTTTAVLLLNKPFKTEKRYIHNKWLFYVYYPAHLIVIYSLYIFGVLF